jgi:uncharacterized protein YidB (DUF937 family)
VAELVQRNPQVVVAVLSLLSSRDRSVGGGDGLAGLVRQFQGAGLGDMISSWISQGPNPPISEQQVSSVLGDDVLGQFAGRAGLPSGQAGSALAALLPAVIDQLTPDGRLPQSSQFDDTLGSLLKTLGH